MMISVIVPIYYGEKYIDGMIRQVETAALRCGEDRIELLLVNDAPDAPIHVETRSDVIDIRIHNSDQNRGIHGVKVWALSFAQGDYVHFLDQDDEISPDYYSSQLEAIGEADVVYCRGYSGRQEIYHTGRVFEDSLLYKNILTRPPMISFGQALLRKGSIPKLWTDHVLKNNSSDDYFLWLSYVSDRKTFATNDTLCFRHTRVGGNFSSDIVRARQSDEEMVQLLMRNGSFATEEIEMLRQLPEKLFNSRYGLLLKEQQFLVALDALIWCKGTGRGLDTYLSDRRIENVAIYGAGILGQRLADLLNDSLIKVSYFIDINEDYIVSELPVYIPESVPMDDKPKIVIITVLNGADKIADMIRSRLGCESLLLTDVLEEMEKDCFRDHVGWRR